MNNTNKITKILGATFVLACANASALETVNGDVGASVSNAFTFTQNNGIDFGTIRATMDSATGGTNVATLALLADGSTSTTAENVAVIAILGTPTVASFSVSGVSPFTNLTVTLPSTATDLTADSGAPNSGKFTIAAAVSTSTTGFTAGGWSVASNGSVIAGTGSTATITSDVGGLVDFEVGAEITTDHTDGDQFIDDDYTATYVITVDY